MIETHESIAKWGVDTFGQATVPAVFSRLKEEMLELGETDPNDFYLLTDEVADVAIMLVQLAYVAGFDLGACIDHKMSINRARGWAIAGDGTGRHV